MNLIPQDDHEKTIMALEYLSEGEKEEEILRHRRRWAETIKLQNKIMETGKRILKSLDEQINTEMEELRTRRKKMDEKNKADIEEYQKRRKKLIDKYEKK
jgi:hypothetical protein